MVRGLYACIQYSYQSEEPSHSMAKPQVSENFFKIYLKIIDISFDKTTPITSALA